MYIPNWTQTVGNEDFQMLEVGPVGDYHLFRTTEEALAFVRGLDYAEHLGCQWTLENGRYGFLAVGRRWGVCKPMPSKEGIETPEWTYRPEE